MIQVVFVGITYYLHGDETLTRSIFIFRNCLNYDKKKLTQESNTNQYLYV